MKGFLASLLLITAVAAHAEVKATAKLQLPKSATIGKAFTATVVVTIPEGWHAYQNPPTKDFQVPVTISTKSKSLVIKKVSYPKGMMKEFAGELTAVLEGTVKIPVSVVMTGKPGAGAVDMNLLIQICDQNSCLRPAIVAVKGSLKLVKG
ncbi:MAG: protein-disulfide reductase DsbD domain-containing protein [Fimbriimonadaceae bacterium]